MKTAAPPISRRDFLTRGALATGGALVLPSFLHASSLGRGPGKSPNDRINMAVIGLGGQGFGHLLGGAWTSLPGGLVGRSDVQVVAVCDVRRERRERAGALSNQMYADRLGRADYDGVQVVHDFRDILARSDIDAVLLALPYHWAAPMSILAMRAGKDVYCEKPVAVTVREGEEVVATCRRYQRIYQAGMQQRSEYAGRFRLACELVRNGRLGRLTDVYAYRQPGALLPTPWMAAEGRPIPSGFDWDLWLGPLPAQPYTGKAGHALPGAFIGDVNWSPHHYDIVQWAIAADPAAAVDIVYEAKGEKAGEAEVHYHYAHGVTVHSAPHPQEKVGQDGGACFVGTQGHLAVERYKMVASPASLLREPLRPEDRRLERATNHVENFLEGVRTRRAPVCEPATAMRTMNAILSGGIALALQRSLRWLPARAEFERDESANRLLAYTPRPPWRT
jgi:hypothetical protein